MLVELQRNSETGSCRAAVSNKAAKLELLAGRRKLKVQNWQKKTRTAKLLLSPVWNNETARKYVKPCLWLRNCSTLHVCMCYLSSTDPHFWFTELASQFLKNTSRETLSKIMWKRSIYHNDLICGSWWQYANKTNMSDSMLWPSSN